MKKEVLNKWVNGWSVNNIALKHKLSVSEVMSILRKEWDAL